MIVSNQIPNMLHMIRNIAQTRIFRIRTICKVRHKRHLHNAVVLLYKLQHFVRNVTFMIADSICTAMGKQNRRTRYIERLLHRVHRHVGQVNQHTDAIHLLHHRYPGHRKPAVKRLCRATAVRIDVVTRVSKRNITHPKRVVKAQDAGAIGYLVQTFGAHETRDDWGTGVVELVPHIASGESGGEIGREAGV